ncbi:hypothetical protein AVEN_30892-1 [Araneus ventricosus]|uniref:Mutator-like transposase domain-containing protein n=1 Tax=Araneus ventricosus TaxID=182803 RepID=A0A4Y2NGX1_ARAVE|nr:hypothetical protein AVEN_30892-1 [Araneus ventricosus]
MNLATPPTKFSNYNTINCKQQEKQVKKVWHKQFRKMKGKRNLAVTVDGSWQKRCFSSKNGLVTLTLSNKAMQGRIRLYHLPITPFLTITVFLTKTLS